jgi:hypothetical protein
VIKHTFQQVKLGQSEGPKMRKNPPAAPMLDFGANPDRRFFPALNLLHIMLPRFAAVFHISRCKATSSVNRWERSGA